MRRLTVMLASVRTLLLLCAILSVAKQATAQELFFSTLSLKDGLPSNIISGIAQDKDDFIWIGTGNGLCRYDGTRLRTFKKTESVNSLSSNEVSCVIVDAGFVWIGTWNGLCRINTTTFEVTRIDLGGSTAIRTLYKGANNIIWIGTESGLIQFDVAADQIVEVFDSRKNNLSHNTIRSIYEDHHGTLWVGTYDKLNKLPRGRHKFDTYDLKGAYRSSLKNNLICGEIRPVPSNDSLLWVGTETGLCLFNTKTGAYERFGEDNAEFSNEVIKCMYLDDEGKLWLGTDFGLSIFDPLYKKSKSYFHNPQLPYSLANNAIWQIYEDRGGVIWFVTSNGLSRLNKQRNFYDYHEVTNMLNDQLVGNQVKGSLITSAGIVWLATLHGVIRIDPKTKARELFSTNSSPAKRILLNNSYALEEDKLGRIWIGTAGGINIWDEKKQAMQSITANASNGLVTNYIAKFIKSENGSLWVSTYQGGLLKMSDLENNAANQKFTPVASEFGSEKAVSGDGSIWYSLYNKLFRVDEKTLEQLHIDSFNKLTARRDVHCLLFSGKGILWAGTQNGLIAYDPQTDSARFHPVLTGNDVNIGNLAEDGAGNIIGVANNFIFRFNESKTTTEIFPLDKDIPIKSFFYGCSATGPDGTIIFGGDNGFISLHSQDLKPNDYRPKVFISSLEINNHLVNTGDEVDGRVLLDKDIAFVDNLTLENTHRSSITLGFSALHFWQPSINVYAYKLEGFDQEWTYVSGARNFAVYSNLSPGTYTFRVKGTNNFGVWSDKEATASILIKPSLFLTNWFLALYACIIIIIIYISLKTYTGRLHLHNELKIARLEKKHTEEVAQIRQQFFTNISHELRTPISLILPPIRQIMKRGNLDTENMRLVTLAEKNSHRLLRLINQILDFRKLESNSMQVKVRCIDLVKFYWEIHALFSDKASRKNITFTFVPVVTELKVWADAEKLETIFYNLLSNAFKFTPKGGEIIVSMRPVGAIAEYAHGAAEIVVTDSGIGITNEDKEKIFDPFFQAREAKQMDLGTGIGLTLVMEYVKLHHGEIKVDSKKGHGSTFTVLLPTGNEHFPVNSVEEHDEINMVATKQQEEIDEAKEYHYDLSGNKPLVLLIDDSTDILDFVRVSISDKYNFIVAENGEEGLQKALNFLPDVIVSDIMMPVMDGLTLCKHVKENPRISHISIILLTAKDQTYQKIEGIRTGADVYITKPFDPEFLEANIDHLIVRKKELSDYFRNELMLQPSEDNKHENVDEKFVRKVIQIIEAHISNPDFSVEVLSGEIGMSSTHLYRKLKSITSLSANEIIKKYRLKKASILLKNKEGNISQIMYDVGFSNLSYFSKCFKTEFGVTPKDFQQKMSVGQFDLEKELPGL